MTTPLLLKKKTHAAPPKDWCRDGSRDKGRKPRNNESNKSKNKEKNKPRKNRDRNDSRLAEGMERFRLEVGHKHEVKPGNIVGAIANEAGLDSKHIGRIEIHDDYSVIDLPTGMPKDIFNTLKKTWVSGTQLKISSLGSESNELKNNSSRKPKSNNKPRSRSKPKPGNKTKNKDRKKKKRKATTS